ncbi:hypothetical protein GUJ93_ZPchr0036g6510 [Zizania palustris]|uniref:Uncharacterized protein n=1 Tax=Zizania palustris TaxID=103762 RepID=A0A8J5QRU4_ZIZPA|nr:hypothetical protein GUJ93_ZPchr0036g6510 [Zizania palustris]
MCHSSPCCADKSWEHKPPEINEERKALADTSAPKSAGVPRNIHCEAQRRCSVPSLKENTVSLKDGEACFGNSRDTQHFEMDDSVPLLKGVHQENERDDAFVGLEETLTCTNSMAAVHQKVAREEFMGANQERESKDPFPSEDKSDRYASLSEAVHRSRVDENRTTWSLHSSGENARQDVEMMAKANHDKPADSQSDEVRVASEDKPAGACKWGRAFSVRRRKKLSDIKIEAINADVDNQLGSALGSPFCRVSIPDGSPDHMKNDPDNHLCMSPQGSKTHSGSNGEADKSKAKDNNEENVGADPAFGSRDDEKNVMDLGYSEMERNRRLEILMAKRRSRKNIVFELDSDLIGAENDQVCRRGDDVASDETEIPGSAPSILHPRKKPFDYTNQRSDGSGVHEHDNSGPHEFMDVSHLDMFFRRHESFNIGSQGRRLSRFKPWSVLDTMDTEVSRESEYGNVSLVADQEDLRECIKNDSSREYESQDLRTM